MVGPVLGGPFTRRLVRCMVIRRFFRLLSLMRGRVDPLGPRSCYEEGKRFGEALCKAYRDQYGIDARIARIFNSYGPRLRAEGFYGRVVSRFLLQALKGEDLTVYGDGSQTRSFCYVTDTVTGLLPREVFIILDDGIFRGSFWHESSRRGSNSGSKQRGRCSAGRQGLAWVVLGVTLSVVSVCHAGVLFPTLGEGGARSLR